MNKTPFSFTINAILIGILAMLFILPVGVTHVMTQLTQTGSQVAGAAAGSGEFVVLPNFFDFGEHASFSPEQDGSVFTDTLRLTSFKGQVATYHTLYTIYNRRDVEVAVELMFEGLPDPPENYHIVAASLASDTIVHTTVLTEAATAGDVTLTVDNASVGKSVHYVVIDGELVTVRAVEGNTLIVDPISKSFAQGTSIYRAGLLVREGKLIRTNTTDVTVAPHDSATLNIVVIGKTDIETSSITLPLFMRVRA